MRCTSIKDSLWRALHYTTLIPGLRPGCLALGYQYAAPLGLILRFHTYTVNSGTSTFGLIRATDMSERVAELKNRRIVELNGLSRNRSRLLLKCRGSGRCP